MKITRKQLRQLIMEMATIKPQPPTMISSDRAITNLNSMVRDPEYRDEYDDVAKTLGYPNDRSYSDDLKTYDDANRMTFDSVEVTEGQSTVEIVTVPIPLELVDEVIKRHQTIVELENQGMRSQDIGRDAYTFRRAGEDVFAHIKDYLDDKYGREPYDIQGYGVEGSSGYRAGEYEKAMMKVGEFF